MKRVCSFQRCFSPLSLVVSYGVFLLLRHLDDENIFSVVVLYRCVWFRAIEKMSRKGNTELLGKSGSV